MSKEYYILQGQHNYELLLIDGRLKNIINSIDNDNLYDYSDFNSLDSYLKYLKIDEENWKFIHDCFNIPYIDYYTKDVFIDELPLIDYIISNFESDMYENYYEFKKLNNCIEFRQVTDIFNYLKNNNGILIGDL